MSLGWFFSLKPRHLGESIAKSRVDVSLGSGKVKFDGPRRRECVYKNDGVGGAEKREKTLWLLRRLPTPRRVSLESAAEELRRGNKNINHGLHTQWQQVNSLSGGDEWWRRWLIGCFSRAPGASFAWLASRHRRRRYAVWFIPPTEKTIKMSRD